MEWVEKGSKGQVISSDTKTNEKKDEIAATAKVSAPKTKQTAKASPKKETKATPKRTAKKETK
jgi:hypothetical protein